MGPSWYRGTIKQYERAAPSPKSCTSSSKKTHERSIKLRRREVTRTKSFGRMDARWGLRVAPVTRFQAWMTWRSTNFVQDMRGVRLWECDQFMRIASAVSVSYVCFASTMIHGSEQCEMWKARWGAPTSVGVGDDITRVQASGGSSQTREKSGRPEQVEERR